MTETQLVFLERDLAFHERKLAFLYNEAALVTRKRCCLAGVKVRFSCFLVVRRVLKWDLGNCDVYRVTQFQRVVLVLFCPMEKHEDYKSGAAR